MKSNGTIGNTVRRNRKSEIQDGGLQSGNTYRSRIIMTCPPPETLASVYDLALRAITVSECREAEPHDRESSSQHEIKSPDDISVGDCRSSSAITCRRRRDQRGYLEISDDE